MGFLSRFIGREAAKVLTGAVNDALNNSNADNPYSQVSVVDEKLQRLTGEKGLRARLEDVVAREWSDCELRKNIPASELGAQRGARRYSYGLYRMGYPIAMIMVVERNGNNKRDVLLAQLASIERGIPYMNFYIHLPNETDYISNRLKANVPSI